MENGPEPRKTVKRILLVDDHERFRQAVRDFLPSSVEVVECADGVDAVKAYETARPDWTLMDIEMPGVDGLTATRHIRADFPAARIAILTQHDTADYRDAAREAGATAFFSKEDLSALERLLTPLLKP